MSLARALLVGYVLLFLICAIDPHDRGVWFAENAPIVLVVAGLAVANRYHRFSVTSLLLLAVFPFLHTIGGHFTFERVPFDWVTDIFGFERNHYDRIAHFSVGFYAYPLAELCRQRRLVSSAWLLYLFPLTVIMAVAAGYEVLEWLYAISADADAGIAVLGSQGDQWDAQKDILADTLGAIVALVLFRFRRRDSGGARQRGLT